MAFLVEKRLDENCSRNVDTGIPYSIPYYRKRKKITILKKIETDLDKRSYV